MPTSAGFLYFIRTIMGIKTSDLADGDPAVEFAYCFALNYVNCAILSFSPFMYTTAVYNLAADMLLQFANSPYFITYRQSNNLLKFTAGVISSSYDESTGQSVANPVALTNLTLQDLQNLKTPYGRQYLAIAQQFGTPWGLS